MRVWFFAIVLLAVAIGCGGGGGSSVPMQQAAAAQARVNVTFLVDVPSALVRTGVESVVVTFVPVGEVVPPAVAPLILDVAAAAADCASAAGKAVCSGRLSVPLGQQNFTIALYAGNDGTGAQLGVKAFTATITGTGQTIDISGANGVIEVVATLTLVITPDTLLAGTASTFDVAVNAFDTSGRLITTPYNVPVTVVAPPTVAPGQPPILTGPTPGPNGLVSLVATGPGQLFPFAYTGTEVGLPVAFTFSAAALDVPPVSARLGIGQPPTPTPAPPTATPAPTPTPTPAPTLGAYATPSPGPIAVAPNVLLFEAPNAPAQTFVASEAGFATFTAVSSNPAVAGVSAAGTTFTVTPVGVGSAVISLSDGAAGTGSVNVYVNATTVIITGRRRH